MQNINVGVVSTRSGARLHLNLHGRASCGAGSCRMIGPARQLVADAVKILCRRCWRRIKAAVAEAIHVVMRRRDSAALRVLNRVADAMLTPAEAKAEENALAEIATAIKTTPSGRKPRTFAELRMLHLGAIERDTAERGQLELCEVTA